MSEKIVVGTIGQADSEKDTFMDYLVKKYSFERRTTSKKIVIGIIGKAGSGKDTFSDYLVKKYSFDKLAFADPLKAGVKAIFMLDDHTAYDRVAREQPLADFPEWSFRKLLQYVGTELFRGHIDDDIWIKLLLKRVREHKNNKFVISDVRFPNELEILKANKSFDFYSFKVVRDGYVGSDVGIKSHASESHDLQADYVVSNNGTIEDLYEKIDIIVAEIVGKNSEALKDI